jgi:hypothetical protein
LLLNNFQQKEKINFGEHIRNNKSNLYSNNAAAATLPPPPPFSTTRPLSGLGIRHCSINELPSFV